jgi:hypothetical protein
MRWFCHTVVTSGLLWPVVALVLGVLDAGGATQGAADIKVVGTSPQLGDDAGSLLWDLVMRGVNAGVPRSAALGPQVLWVRGYLNCTCRVLPFLCPRPLTGGGWVMRQGLHVRGSSQRRCCCMIRLPRSTRTSYVRFRSV